MEILEFILLQSQNCKELLIGLYPYFQTDEESSEKDLAMTAYYFAK